MRVGHIDLHLTKGDINGNPNVHIGELWLGSKEDGASFGKVADGGVMEAVGLGCRIEAALGVHVELAVTLTSIHWCAVEGVFALCTLNKMQNTIDGLNLTNKQNKQHFFHILNISLIT